MAERLRHQSSKVPDDGNHQGCMQGLLHFLDFNQRLHIRKMLEYRRHGDGKLSGRIKFPKMKQKASSACEEHGFLDRDGSIPIEDKASATNKSSGKALMRTLNSKRRSREQDQKRNISPFASRLVRTISIHHLESNDYVDNMAPNSENATVEHNSHESSSSANREHIPLLAKASGKPCEVCGTLNTIDYVGQTQLDGLSNHLLEKQSLLREKLNEAKEVLSEQKGTDAKEPGIDVAFHQSKEFLDLMELLNANRELFLKFLQDPSFIANYLRGQQTSTAERVLGKSGSFPVTGLSGRKNDGLSRLKHKPKENELVVGQNGDFQAATSSPDPNANENSALPMESLAGDEVCILKPEPATTDSTRIGSSFDNLSSFCELKDQRDDRTASNRFKVIKKRIKDVIRDNRKEGHRISMDGVLHKIPYGRKLSKDVKKEKQGLWEAPGTARYDRDSSRTRNIKSIKRSHSLIESLDKYSRLLESISSREFKRLPERSKLKQEDGGNSQGRASSKTLGRIFSLPDFESYSLRKDVQYKTLDAAESLKIPAAVDLYDFNEPKTAGTLLHTEECMEADTSVRNTIEADASGTIYGGQEQPVLSYEQDKCEAYDVSKYLKAEDSSYSPLHEQETENEVAHSDEPTKPSPISVLDLYSPEVPVSPAKVSVSEGASELKPRRIHFEKLDSLTNLQSQSDADASDVLEATEADTDRLQMPRELDDFNLLHVQVDQKDEAEFNYVRDILLKSGFGGDEFLGAWYSPDQPVDPSLFDEAEYTSFETDIAGDEPEMSLEHQLLFDLINEVLLEIYDTCFACCPWLSHFDSRIRPMPVGHHVLEEVWANISWYLSSQPQLDPTLDHVVARDFAKNDGWMDLQYDCEYVGLELEDLILDDLLDEVILELGDLSGPQRVFP